MTLSGKRGNRKGGRGENRREKKSKFYSGKGRESKRSRHGAIKRRYRKPSYDDNKRVTVDQFNTKLDNSKFVTGKRLGYDFDVDDI